MRDFLAVLALLALIAAGLMWCGVLSAADVAAMVEGVM